MAPGILGTFRTLLFILGLGVSALSARAAEPFLVTDIDLGADSSSPLELTVVNGVLLFSADDAISRRELWMSDGTAVGMGMVKDIACGFRSSSPAELTAVNGTLFFHAPDGTNVGMELWKTDGTASGTVMVKDVHHQFSASIMRRKFTGAAECLFLQSD